jgi:serine O-acetyltransferase
VFENIKQDYYRSIYFRETGKSRPKATLPRILFTAFRDGGFCAVFLYRLGRWFRSKHLGLVAAIIERLMLHLCQCWISTTARIGPGLVVAHPWGIVIPPGAVLGSDCFLLHRITIGTNHDKKDKNGNSLPVIGDNVEICPGAAVLGPIVVGSHSIIGANATLTTSVPENSVVGTFRAEVLGQCSANRALFNSGKRIALSRRELFEWIEKLQRRIEELEKTAN